MTTLDTIFGTTPLSASTLRRVDTGAYWQGQTVEVEADSLTIGYRVARSLAWENRSRRPIIGGTVQVDRLSA